MSVNKELSSPIMKAVTAATILLVLISADSTMNYIYAAKKNTPIQNESNLPTPVPLPIPPPGLLGTLKVTTTVLGGNNKPSDFTITVSAKGPSPGSFSGSSSGTTVTLKPGKYSVSASSLSGYTTTYSSGCSGSNGGKNINLCTVTNQYTPPPGSTTFLSVVTKVDNTNGGTKQPSDFAITVSGNSPKPKSFSGSSSGTSVTLQAGKYSVSGSSISGYTTTYSSGCSGTANGGVPIKCTVTNQYTLVGSLTFLNVITKVDNSNGGTKKPSNFTITVSGNSPSPRTFSGSSTGTSVRLSSGSYEVTGNSIPDYSTSYSPACSGTANGGVPIKCTITNQYHGKPTPPPPAPPNKPSNTTGVVA